MRQLGRVLMRPRLLRTRKGDYGRRREARRQWRPAGSGWSCSGSARGGAGNCFLTPGVFLGRHLIGMEILVV